MAQGFTSAIPVPLPVNRGGTGTLSFTPYTVLVGGTTTTNPIQNIASVGTAGQILTSNGAGALPTFQNVAAGTGITRVVRRIITATGTYVPTAGMVYAIYEMCGGGGASGGASGGTSAANAGGGGGAGQYANGILTAAQVGLGLAITIGAGGTSPGAAAGGTGTATTIAGVFSCAPGVGGAIGTPSASVSSAQGGNGGSSGTGPIFTYTVAGQSGFPGWTSGITIGFGGGGGSTGGGLGTGGKERVVGSGSGAVLGVEGSGFGSGASGATAFGLVNAAGADGQPGVVIITEYVV